MRILNFRADHPFFAEGLMEGLSAVGHQVHNLNPALQPDPSRFLAAAIDRVHPDLVMTAGVANQIFDTEALWPVLRQKGVPHLYWAIEDSSFFEEWSLPHARHADLVLTTAPECLPWYQARGIRADVLEFGCNPRLHHHRYAPDPALAHDIILVSHNQVHSPAFAGMRDRLTFRAQCLENLVLPLVRGGYDIMLWGNYWEHPDLGIPNRHLGGPTDFHFPWKAYASSKIVLGVEWVDTPGGHLSCKTWEILGCRAFHLAPCTPALARHFQRGRHLICADSPEESLRLVDYYLSHPAERAEIAQEGQRLVYAQHTYLHRAKELTAKVAAAGLLSGHASPLDRSSWTRHKGWVEKAMADERQMNRAPAWRHESR